MAWKLGKKCSHCQIDDVITILGYFENGNLQKNYPKCDFKIGKYCDEDVEISKT